MAAPSVLRLSPTICVYFSKSNVSSDLPLFIKMKEFDQYKMRFSVIANEMGYQRDEIEKMLYYAEHLNDQNLPIIFDQYHLSRLVGYDYTYLLGAANAQSYFYKHYEIPKKSGGVRSIEEPLPSLKYIQTWILENILAPASEKLVSPVAKAFMPRLNLRDNARFHRKMDVVVALDLHDFFGSINFGEVYGVFKKLGYCNSVVMMLTKLCMYKGSLPQGAPTSPMLSNLMFYDLDEKIFHYCQKRKIRYTRYADDMTFSGNDIKINRLISYIKMLVKYRHLTLNEEKTRVMRKGCSQRVTGVVVNEYMQVPKVYRDKVRQEVYYCIKYGFAEHMKRISLPSWITTVEIYQHHLLGKINYILQINSKDEEFIKYAKWLKEQI